MKPKFTKIIVTEKHSKEKIGLIISAKKPGKLILESSSRMFNLKTQWIAQELIRGGWNDCMVKLSYKGNLFKVILSSGSPEEAQDAKGVFTGPIKAKLTAGKWNET